MNRTGSNIPIVHALRELKFGRPAWVQKMMIKFIEEAFKQCEANKSDGTFNDIVDKVWERNGDAKR